MPTFDTLPLNEARANSATGARGAASGIQGVYQARSAGTSGEARAGRERDDPGGPAQACRSGGSTGEGTTGPPSADAVYFWSPETPRRGRSRKNPAA